MNCPECGASMEQGWLFASKDGAFGYAVSRGKGVSARLARLRNADDLELIRRKKRIWRIGVHAARTRAENDHSNGIHLHIFLPNKIKTERNSTCLVQIYHVQFSTMPGKCKVERVNKKRDPEKAAHVCYFCSVNPGDPSTAEDRRRRSVRSR